ncbi:LysR family transcriptional regulator [Pseudactinotalea sp. HY160]|uniref:LysR family transcriptional regulator n=1 Tax=Pseudactinotalea sp. HY160 TaxID=2654490 RepID=UPI00128D5323|nr:LysR family transcriptional regulator [Pseudactinotalea sp. HY160]MPV48670.1 LysR family transcriptional regulator [Pseudactinotalea sp. HY160]
MAGVDLEELRLLVAVADHGSISAAARLRRISQPSASARMRRLEHSLGLELLDRRSRGAELTDHGRAVTSWARSVLAAADALLTGAEALRTDRPVRVAASQTIAEFLVPAWLAQARERSGEPVHLRVANSAAVVAAVRDRSADLGFIEGPRAPSDLTWTTVRTDRLVLVVAPGHRLARVRSPLSAEQVAALALASREEGSGTRETLARALRRAGVSAVSGPAVTVDSNAAVKVVVAAGAVPAMLSELAVAAELQDGRLVEVPTAGLDTRRRLRAVWRRGTAPRAGGAALLAIATGR